MKFDNIQEKKSLQDPANRKLYKVANAKGIIAVDNSLPSMVSTPNINGTLGALNFIRPSAIEILTAPMVADKIARAQQNGRYGDESITIKVKEYTGTTTADDGLTGDGINSGVNIENRMKGVYYFQANVHLTDREKASFSGMQENLRADSVDAQMRAIAMTHNTVFFTGVEDKSLAMPVNGFLNDPDLLPFVPQTTTAWATAQPQEIYNDIVAMLAKISERTKGLSEDFLANGASLLLCVSPLFKQYLDRANDYGVKASQLIRDSYPTLDIVVVPQFSKAQETKDVMYLVVRPASMDVVLNSFVEKARAYPWFIHGSEESQKIGGATSGCIVQYPMFIERWTMKDK